MEVKKHVLMKATYIQPDKSPVLSPMFIWAFYGYTHAFYVEVGVDRGQETQKGRWNAIESQDSKERFERVI